MDTLVGSSAVMELLKAVKKINKEQIDFILMPWSCIDEKGGRIGYGGGFYDKFLSDVKKFCS